MTRLALVLLVAAGCGGSHAPPQPPQHTAPPDAGATAVGDVDAGALADCPAYVDCMPGPDRIGPCPDPALLERCPNVGIAY